MEKTTYRDNLERIKEAFPDKELLTTSDVARFLGRDRRYVTKHYPMVDNAISVASLARCLAV